MQGVLKSRYCIKFIILNEHFELMITKVLLVYRKLHGPRSINDKSHACLAKCVLIIIIINIAPNTSVIFH